MKVIISLAVVRLTSQGHRWQEYQVCCQLEVLSNGCDLETSLDSCCHKKRFGKDGQSLRLWKILEAEKMSGREIRSKCDQSLPHEHLTSHQKPGKQVQGSGGEDQTNLLDFFFVSSRNQMGSMMAIGR